MSENVVGLDTECLEVFESLVVLVVNAPHDEGHGRREHEVLALAFDAVLVLKVAQEVSEVDVEEVSVFGHHDVIAVPVAQAQHIGGHTAARTGSHVVVHRLGVLLFAAIVLLDVLGYYVHLNADYTIHT